MPVVADLSVDVEVVEQHETLRERMCVGCDVLPEQREPRIAVSLRQVAEKLVVGTVFPDDVKDVLDRRAEADRPRNR